MKLGLHYLLSCDESHTPAQRYRETIEQAVRGEALGFESVWPVEQHFNRGVSVMPSPMLLLAAIAQRTRTLRLGTAIVQLPLNHPVRVAEEAAVLDVLSGGRVELGVGRGSNPAHFAGLGVPMAEARDRLVEGIEIIRRAWTEERFTFRGQVFDIDAVSVHPKPSQRPHPPIRVAANSPETAELAARMGLPVLVAANVNPFPRLRELITTYRGARAAAGHLRTPDDVTILMPLYVGENMDEVRRDVEPSIARYVRILSEGAAAILAGCTSDVERDKLSVLLARMRATTFDSLNDAMGILATPEVCAERLQHIARDLDPGRVIAWFNFGGLVPHERVLRSMELFSSRVMPRL